MSEYKQFIFKKYDFVAETKTLRLYYAYDEAITFCESYVFDFDFADYDPAVLDRACQLLFFLAGVSYYKAYLPPEIKVEAGQIDSELAGFLSKTYQKGLGEFFYVNGLSPETAVNFPVTAGHLGAVNFKSEGMLVGIGGGKDSLVSVELLRDKADKLATWSVGHRGQLEPLVNRLGTPHYWVERQIDKSLLEHNKQGALNGHIPISAILAGAGAVAAVLSGRQDIVVSNEHSANEPALKYQGIAINHQYSKSQEFEEDFQTILRQYFGDSLRYYSLLRPLSELRIAELFTPYFDKYHDVFSSCNRAFTQDARHIFWDGTCPKCAFIFLALTPFVGRDKLEALFSGKDLLLDPELGPTYRNLLGIEGDKPLECVGEIKESRSAMDLAKKQYPELSKYQYDIPGDYNYRTIFKNSMPAEVWQVIQSKI